MNHVRKVSTNQLEGQTSLGTKQLEEAAVRENIPDNRIITNMTN